MAIFNKTDVQKTASPRSGAADNVTIIAPGNHLAGQFTIAGLLHVNGQIEGEVVSSARIDVGASGEIIGVVRADSLHVAGLVKADVWCQNLVVLAGGEVHGLLQCDELVVEPSGQFFGERKAYAAQQELAVELAEITHSPRDESQE